MFHGYIIPCSNSYSFIRSIAILEMQQDNWILWWSYLVVLYSKKEMSNKWLLVITMLKDADDFCNFKFVSVCIFTDFKLPKRLHFHSQRHWSDRGHNVCNGVGMFKNSVLFPFSLNHLAVTCMYHLGYLQMFAVSTVKYSKSVLKMRSSVELLKVVI